MQEAQVGWDPISINRVPPWHLRLCLFFLVVLAVTAIVRFLEISWKLRSDRRKHPVEDHTLLAIVALRGGKIESTPDPASWQRQTVEFHYHWAVTYDLVRSLKNWIKPTLLVVSAEFVWGLMNALESVSYMKAAGFAAFAGRLAEACIPLTIGLLVCAFISVMSSHFENKLQKRKTQWEYFCAKHGNE